MSVHQRLANALDRIVSSSSVARNRMAEAERASIRGDDSALTERMESVVTRFETLADEMEKAIA